MSHIVLYKNSSLRRIIQTHFLAITTSSFASIYFSWDSRCSLSYFFFSRLDFTYFLTWIQRQTRAVRWCLRYVYQKSPLWSKAMTDFKFVHQWRESVCVGDNRMHCASEGVGIDLLWKGQVEADLYLLHIQQESWEMSFLSWRKPATVANEATPDVVLNVSRSMFVVVT